MMDTDTYMLEGTREDLAATLRCRVSDLNTALPNLKASELGEVTLHGNGNVTLISRRLKRESDARKNGALRVARFRSNAKCNADTPLVSGSGSSEPSGIGVQGEGIIQQLRREMDEHFKRPVGSRWNCEEERLLVEICQSPTVSHEWHTILGYRSARKEYQRQTLLALLQNWTGELDKARNYEPTAHQPQRTGPTLKEVQEECRIKWSDDSRHSHWAASFYGYWSDRKRNWKRDGKQIDWQIELSKNVARWRAEG